VEASAIHLSAIHLPVVSQRLLFLVPVAPLAPLLPMHGKRLVEVQPGTVEYSHYNRTQTTTLGERWLQASTSLQRSQYAVIMALARQCARALSRD
jgi:hypothetical protein